MTTSRRTVLGAGTGAALAGGLTPGTARAQGAGAAVAEADRILRTYAGFGDKASGGPGDEACGAWLEGELAALGYACRRQAIEVPAFDGAATLELAGARIGLIPQAIVRTTPPGGLTAPLRVAGEADAAGALAVLVLPHARWSSAKGEIERRVQAVLKSGAAGVLIVTTGPTGEALALNAPADAALFDRPVAVLAPREADPVLRASRAGGSATLRIEGRAYRRPAWNLTAVLARGAARHVVLSTPRSGWFGCAGERGPGLAAWLMLARWAARTRLPANVALVATSGHEYENAGGERYIHELAPPPAATALWAHLGANVAARDWHERGPVLAPLPSADPQRFLLASPPVLDAARAAFAGLPGLEAVYAGDPKQAAGELGNILHAGYTAAGIFGSHRYHHARNDDLRCVAPDLVPPVVRAMQGVIRAALA